MKKITLISFTALLMTSCGNQAVYPTDNSAHAPEVSMIEEVQSFSAQKDRASGAAPNDTNANDNPSNLSFMAYRYNYGFVLPAKNVATTAKSHAEICLEAGPDRCQVLHSNTHSNGEDYVTGQLQIRGEPGWLEGFKAQIQSSVEAAKGELKSSSVNAEDLTRQILDTDARLKAKKTLRTRLEDHLETRNAKLQDLLALERELARVQGEIESATSTLGVLRKRVSMSVVDISYQSRSVAVSQSAVSPIGRALKDFVGDISYGLANVIRFFAAILPWLLFVILPLLWLLRRFWRSRKLRITGPTETKAKT